MTLKTVRNASDEAAHFQGLYDKDGRSLSLLPGEGALVDVPEDADGNPRLHSQLEIVDAPKPAPSPPPAAAASVPAAQPVVVDDDSKE